MEILGTSYKFEESDTLHDKDLVGLDAYTDFDGKTIVMNKEIDTETRRRATKRHELLHAFLYESGLDSSSWGRNEEIVDWIAIQFPKMLKAFTEAGCI